MQTSVNEVQSRLGAGRKSDGRRLQKKVRKESRELKLATAQTFGLNINQWQQHSGTARSFWNNSDRKPRVEIERG